jgi:recombination protein RecT
MSTTTQEVAVLTKADLMKPGTAKSLKQLLESNHNAFATALPRHMTPERMIRVALTAFNTTTELQKCSLMSIAAAVVQASILGLEPNSVLGEAYLIPFKGQCVLVPGWKGLLKLVRNSGQLVTVNAQAVHAKDQFEIDGDALEPILIHKRAAGDRGPVTGYWAGALLKGGGKQIVYLSKEEATAHGKKYSKAYDSKFSGWQTDFDAMALKTCIRKLCKYLPQSVELQIAMDLASRAELEQTQRFSVDVPMDWHPVITDGEGDEGVAAEIAAPQAKEAQPDIDRTETGQPAAASDKPAALVTKTQIVRLHQIAGENGWREQDVLPWIKQKYNVDKVEALRAADYDGLIEAIKAGGEIPK